MGSKGLVILALCVVVYTSEQALGNFIAFAGDENAHSQFASAAGNDLRVENFDSFGNNTNVTALPTLRVSFEDPVPFASAYAPFHVFRRSEPNQLANARPNPPFAPYNIRPDPGRLITALGFWETSSTVAGTDQLRITAFDEDDSILGSVDTPFAGVAFAGFVVSPGASRVQISVLGNADGLNGLDDLQIQTVPEPASLSPLALAGIAAVRRRRDVR